MRIEDYALVGDTQTAALVSRTGSIDWLCLPRFDSAACFAALLGSREHGRFLLAPRGEVTRTSRRYRGDSLILETDVETADGAVRIIDCMPVRDGVPDVVRVVQGLRGRVAMRLELILRFGYGDIVPWVRRIDGRLLAIAGPDGVVLSTPIQTRGEDLTTRADFEVAAGDRVPFVLTWFPSHQPVPDSIDALSAIDDTERWWRAWVARSHCSGPYRDDVVRSLITLKALTYQPTGGIVAAATTSLPEALGGERNWDYRYCWLRDATFSLYAMMQAGYTEEACAWRDWLLRAVAGDVSRLQIMYGAAGERYLPERTLPWLPGYEGSRPVRIGNDAVNQLQLDVYGEVIDTLHQARRAGIRSDPDSWALQRMLADWLESNWQKPDEGLWEIRAPRRQFTHSKVMAWVAMDRTVKAVEQFGERGDAARWAAARDAIHHEVCTRAWSPELAAFAQSYGANIVDASALLIPQVGFLPPDDPRVASTIAAVERTLLRDGFVRRYPPSDDPVLSSHDALGEAARAASRPGAADRAAASRPGAASPHHAQDDSVLDGLPGCEGAFLACSFWLVDAYVLLGRRDDARRLFERLLAVRNDVGLLSEEYDLQHRRLVGNFPQAFSHVALINSARNLTAETGPATQRKST